MKPDQHKSGPNMSSGDQKIIRQSPPNTSDPTNASPCDTPEELNLNLDFKTEKERAKTAVKDTQTNHTPVIISGH